MTRPLSRIKMLLKDIAIISVALTISWASQAKGYTTPSTLFVGDSLAIGTAPHIHVRGMKVDARIGRPLREGMAVLENYRRPKRLLISLGSNNLPPSFPEMTNSIIYSIHRAKCVVWSTLYVGGYDFGEINHWMRKRETSYFRVVDWARKVRRHPELMADYVHPTPHGYYVRSRMYVKEMHKCR